MRDVIAARLHLIATMIRLADSGSCRFDYAREVAEEGRSVAHGPWVMTAQEWVSLGMVALFEFGPLWNRYTQDHPRYFDADLLGAMENFMGAVAAAQRNARAAEPVVARFDADLSPQAAANVEAAKAHHVRYDSEQQQYVGIDDGCPRFDRFGQRL